jgi:GNAT superfamily N-acetyltransferase
LKIARDNSPDVAKAVEEGLTAFNNKVVGAFTSVPVNVSVRDDDGVVRGGVVGSFVFDTLYISLVWLDDSLRGTGHGRAMMELAEAEGRALGATQSWLYTLSWQARPFYESLGYKVFGEMPFVNATHRRYFMLKSL